MPQCLQLGLARSPKGEDVEARPFPIQTNSPSAPRGAAGRTAAPARGAVPGPDRCAAPLRDQAAVCKGSGPRPCEPGRGVPPETSPSPHGSGGSRQAAGAEDLACLYPATLAAPHLSHPSHAATALHTPLLFSLLPLSSFCRQATPSVGNQPAAAKLVVVILYSFLLLAGAQRAGPRKRPCVLNLPRPGAAVCGARRCLAPGCEGELRQCPQRLKSASGRTEGMGAAPVGRRQAPNKSTWGLPGGTAGQTLCGRY